MKEYDPEKRHERYLKNKPEELKKAKKRYQNNKDDLKKKALTRYYLNHAENKKKNRERMRKKRAEMKKSKEKCSTVKIDVSKKHNIIKNDKNQCQKNTNSTKTS